MRNLHKKQSGLSLVEILVALVISLFLLGGIVQVFIGNKTTYRFSDASARVQENGRFALETITSDIRMAGSWGCYSFTPGADEDQYLFNNLNFTANGSFDFANQPAIGATSTAGNPVITDTLTIRGAEPGLTTITKTLPTESANNVVVPATNPFNAGDIVVLTNCFAANIFQISAIGTSTDGPTISHGTGTGSPGNATDLIRSTTNNVFSANSAALFKLQEVTYSIGVSGSGNGEPALFRNRNGTNDELLEGIENLQVMFGVDTDDDDAANQYLEPGAVAVADLPNVTAVRLWLVVRSERDFIVDAVQPYSINGNEVIPPDQRFRQVFSTTIALRNRAG